jgi:CheY-like chemotaxis protein
MKKILVVDDEKDLVTLLAWNLHREGYRVITACDGIEAISVVKHVIPDLMLLDIMMPGMDGMAVLRKFRQDGVARNIPIVMVTARRESSMILDALECGATDVVLKPFPMKHMMQWVERWLQGTCLRPVIQPSGELKSY